MNKSFNSNSTYCSVIQKPKNKKLKRSNVSAILTNITNRVQLHMKGKYLLANCEIKQYLEQIANCKAVANKVKYRTGKLRTILNIIYTRNNLFEKHMANMQTSTVLKDPFTQLGLTQDLQMLASSGGKLERIRFPITNNNQTPSFYSNMLTNQNFKSRTEEFDKSTDKSPELIHHTNYSALKMPNHSTISGFDVDKKNNNFNKDEYIYSNGPETDTGQSLELIAIDFNLTDEENSQIHINRNRTTLDNVESASFCPVSGNNIDNSQNGSQLLINSLKNLQKCCNVNPDNMLDDTDSFTSYRDTLSMQYLLNNNSDTSTFSDTCSENAESNNQTFEKHFNHSDDIFSCENSIEPTKTNRMLTLDREQQTVHSKADTKCLATSKTLQKIDFISLDLDTNNVMNVSPNKEKSIHNVKTFVLNKNDFNNESNNSSILATTLEDSCDDLCQLMSKFLNIVDDRDIEGNGAKCVDIIKSMKNPQTVKKNVEEIGQIGTFVQKSYNKKMSNLIHNVVTNSMWQELSDDIENINQSNQEISGFLMKIFESTEFPEHNNESFNGMKVDVIECLDPADVDELDLNTVFDCNAEIIQDISKSFQKQFLADDFFQLNCTSVAYDCLDWRKIQI